jgi:hypothetical protein
MGFIPVRTPLRFAKGRLWQPAPKAKHIPREGAAPLWIAIQIRNPEWPNCHNTQGAANPGLTSGLPRVVEGLSRPADFFEPAVGFFPSLH